MTDRNLPFRSVNPATEEVVVEVPFLEEEAIDRRLAAASEASSEWRQCPFGARGRLLEALAARLEEEREPLAKLATQEMGKLLAAARAEIDKCVWLCRHLANHAEGWLAPEWISREQDVVEVRCEPLGTILAIAPWNFPYWQVLRAVAPALAAGNTVLVKPSELVPGTVLALERLLVGAGFPPGVCQLLWVPRSGIADLIRDPRVHGVCLTGSERTGREVAALAGAALKPVVLELGGSDPFLVFPSADLAAALECAVSSRIQNNGQSCIAAKRFLLHRAVADEFERRLVAAFEALRLGDPRSPETELGPLVSVQACERLEQQVRNSIDAGAELLTGGVRRPGPGAFFLPTVLRNPPPGSPAFEEELFGPVATVYRFETVSEALELAAAPGFGLGASVWTRNEREAEAVVRGVRAGTVAVNSMVASDPRIPFGGSGRSGFGRELGRQGVLAFTHVKAICGVAASDRERAAATGRREIR